MGIVLNLLKSNMFYNLKTYNEVNKMINETITSTFVHDEPTIPGESKLNRWSLTQCGNIFDL